MDNYHKNTKLKDLPGEIWESATGFDGLYEVSNLGRVKALETMVEQPNGSTYLKKERILKQIVNSRSKQNNSMTMYVTLRLNGKSYNKMVASLVINSFYEHPGGNYQTHHINGICHDNRLENLTYEDRSTKQKIEYDNGVRSRATAKRVWEDRMEGDLAEKWKPGTKGGLKGMEKGTRFKNRNQEPVTVYIKSKRSIRVFATIHSAADILGISLSLLRSALNSPKHHAEVQVKKGQLTLDEFEPK